MSWNLFKTQLGMKMKIPSTAMSAVTDRIPSIGRSLDSLYSTHFDTATAGGRLLKVPVISQVFQLGLQEHLLKNRLSTNITPERVSSQVKSQALKYWIGRVINGPTGTTIVLFPGIWVPFDNLVNLVPGAKRWVDLISISLFIQKMSLLGITIQKAPPGVVTPWSGTMFQGFDTPLNVSQVLSPMQMNFSNFIKLTFELKGGSPEIANQIKEKFNQALETVFSPAIFEQISSFPNQYGVNFSELNYPSAYDFPNF